MSSPLDGCWAKIERANENIRNLDREISEYLRSDPKPYRVVGQHENNAREYSFTGFSEPVPLRFSVLAGEIVHHLRSSLDHLVWALVLARHKSPTFRVQFPICLTRRQFEKARKDGIVKGISGSALAIIERVQPYTRADPADSALAILHAYDISDKHTLLVVVTSSVFLGPMITINDAKDFPPDAPKSDVVITGMGPPQATMSKDGTKIFTVTFESPAPHVEVDPQFSPQIAFEKFGATEFKPVVPGLVHLRDRVVQTIKLFAGEF